MKETKKTWQRNSDCDSGLDPFAIKDIVGKTGRTWTGSEDFGYITMLTSWFWWLYCGCCGECPWFWELHFKECGVIGHQVSNVLSNSEGKYGLKIFLEVWDCL